MENLALISPKFPVLAGARSPSLIPGRERSSSPALPRIPARRSGAIGGGRRLRVVPFALGRAGGDSVGASSQRIPKITLPEKFGIQAFASISTSSSSEMTSSGTPPVQLSPPPSSIGSPLFWIGVGVGLSALFSVVATRVKRYAMQQAFKTMMDQAGQQISPFNNSTFSPGSPFPFPTASPSDAITSSPAHTSHRQSVTVDVPATKVETTPPVEIEDKTEVEKERKKYAFVDVSPEEVMQKDREFSEESREQSAKDIHPENDILPNGVAVKQAKSTSKEQSQSSKSASVLSVEALEKMMEDPTVQKMVYPYLPEEMRNPTTFKWMLQNPQYRQQLQDMLSNMGGSTEWDNRVMDSLKSFDLSSPEVKQQFEQIGLTPEEVISKIMANPEVAMAFQNPKVQAAIMDCSQNPLSIAKYQNDKEVMDVFTKISELFPGVTGSP